MGRETGWGVRDRARCHVGFQKCVCVCGNSHVIPRLGESRGAWVGGCRGRRGVRRAREGWGEGGGRMGKEGGRGRGQLPFPLWLPLSPKLRTVAVQCVMGPCGAVRGPGTYGLWDDGVGKGRGGEEKEGGRERTSGLTLLSGHMNGWVSLGLRINTHVQLTM